LCDRHHACLKRKALLITEIEVGVAKPRAQGQAIIKTLTIVIIERERFSSK